jgi:hypothetical protein
MAVQNTPTAIIHRASRLLCAVFPNRIGKTARKHLWDSALSFAKNVGELGNGVDRSAGAIREAGGLIHASSWSGMPACPSTVGRDRFNPAV